jgi:hypothetical protein
MSCLFFSGFAIHDVLNEWALVTHPGQSTGEAKLLASREALLKPTAKVG